MPRPKKATVDYFPHYCSHGKTMHILESKFGNDGYAFFFKLLELLGTTENHFIDCNEPTAWEYLLAKTLVDEEKANWILNLCASLGAINEKFWKLKIIWSENFVENLDAVYRRREIDVFTSEDIEGYCRQKHYLNGKIVNKNPQSREKERKGEESKEENRPRASLSKQEKFKTKIEEMIASLNATWEENSKYYMTKYPGIDHVLEKQKMECWIRENPGKALKRSNLNLFCHSWLGRVRPNFKLFERIVEAFPVDRPGPGETREEFEARRERAHGGGNDLQSAEG